MSTVTLSESDVARMAPDASAYASGRDLVRKKKFSGLGVSADGTWLLAKCQGSGAKPYEVSVDLGDSTNPTCRCTCPSRKFPCKHGLGLMLSYIQEPGKFAAQEPPAELLARREKQVDRARKKADEGGAAAPRKVNKAAQAKKTAAQREGLDLLEKLVVDLVSGGDWSEKSRLDRLQRQAKQLNDAFLPAAMHTVSQLVVLGQGAGLSQEERQASASDLIGQLWATVQKGRSYLDEKLGGDESQAEADAVVENVLGRSWQLGELKEKGYFKANLALLELAYERYDDQARQQRIEISHEVELQGGEVYQAITYRPFKGMQHIAEQPSYLQPLQVAEAAVYPGFLNRRVRWDKGAARAEQLTPAHLKQAYDVARPDLKGALEAFRQQLKHPLAPREAVLLVRFARVGRIGDRLVLEDAAGSRVVAQDRSPEGCGAANLARAAGGIGKARPAVLARFYLQPSTNTILAEPLGLLTPDSHLRLGI